ncbi:MAG: Nucleotidyltransferase domain protein [Candidatus Izimaplasma bacterium HR2]|nr:MAG: Nucleotidyltransferase domain protein [Candidatus Izimaplasma bacterium HR2]
MLLDKEIDIKFFYRFVEFTSKLLKIDLTHEKFKLIILDKQKAETKTEMNIKSFADSYMFALNNVNQIFFRNTLQSMYFLLTHTKLEDSVCDKIISEYYISYDGPSHYLAALMHLYVMKTEIDRKHELAFIISNLIMIKKGRYPMVPYVFVHKSYLRAIKEENMEKLMMIFSQIETKEKHEIKESYVSKEIIIDTIKRLKPNIVSKYKVKKLYLYGSYAKEITTTNSDIDFLVVYKDNLINLERSQRQNSLKEFLKRELDKTIDLLDFTHALNKLDISEMENLITLI